MADAVDPTGADAPKPDADKLAAELESLKRTLAETQAKADAAERKFLEAKEGRDKAKQKEREEAEKRGDFEAARKLLEDENAALKAQTAEIDVLKAKAAKADEMIEARRQELLAKLPEANREAYKDDTVEQITKALALIPESQPVPPTDRAKPPQGGNGAGKNWYAMTETERMAWSNGKTPEQIKAKIKDDFATKDK